MVAPILMAIYVYLHVYALNPVVVGYITFYCFGREFPESLKIKKSGKQKPYPQASCCTQKHQCIQHLALQFQICTMVFKGSPGFLYLVLTSYNRN